MNHHPSSISEGECLSSPQLISSEAIKLSSSAGSRKLIDNRKEEIKKSKSNIEAFDSLSLGNPPILFKEKKQNLKSNLKKEEIIIDEAIIERKKLSFNLLKKWDNHRCQQLHIHSTFLEEIPIKLEQKTETSNYLMKNLLKFFKERINQETEYKNSMNTKIPLLNIFSNNEISKKKIEKSFCPSLIKGLQSIDEMGEKIKKKRDNFLNYLEKTIVNEILTEEMNNYKKCLSSMRAKIGDLKKSLNNINLEISEKSTKYAKIYHEMIEPDQKTFAKDVDLYNKQLSFLKCAAEQSKIHKQLGKEISTYWSEIIKLDIKRYRLIQTTMLNYLIQSKESLGKDDSQEIPINNLKDLSSQEEVEAFYAIPNILTSSQIEILIKFNQNPEITFSNLQNYLENFSIKETEDSPLILKQIFLQREFNKIKRPCCLIITVDNNLLIFDEVENYKRAPANYCIKLDRLILKLSSDPLKVELVEKTNWIVFDSKNTFILFFEQNDNSDEFVNYCNFLNIPIEEKY